MAGWCPPTRNGGRNRFKNGYSLSRNMPEATHPARRKSPLHSTAVDTPTTRCSQAFRSSPGSWISRGPTGQETRSATSLGTWSPGIPPRPDRSREGPSFPGPRDHPSALRPRTCRAPDDALCSSRSFHVRRIPPQATLPASSSRFRHWHGRCFGADGRQGGVPDRLRVPIRGPPQRLQTQGWEGSRCGAAGSAFAVDTPTTISCCGARWPVHERTPVPG